MDDLISRQAAIDALDVLCQEHRYKIPGKMETYSQYNEAWQDALDKAEGAIFNLPSAHPDITDEQAIVHLQASGWMQSHDKQMYEMGLKERLADDSDSYDALLPSAQPERTCVNCGRTANNGGWYADGGTRCPIEEHYALPKDGYCHLWEKRNVTDDDYPERRTDDSISD